MVHPYAPNKGGSVYHAEAPYFKKEEEARRFAEYGECVAGGEPAMQQ